MAVRTRTPAIERVVAAYNVLLAGVWAATHTRLGVGLAAVHLLAATVPWLFDRAAERRPGGTWIFRDLYPALFLAPMWGELDLLRDLAARPTFDPLFATLDQTLFGSHATYTWVRAMPWPWLSEVMEATYFLYYAAAFLPPLVLAFLRRRDALRDAVASLMATYLACYVFYLIIPVDGPREVFPRYIAGLTDGFWWRLNEAAHASGDSGGTAFPSSHVAGVVAMACVAWRQFSRPVAMLFVAEAVGVCVAVIYTQNHYPLDILSGLVLAALVQYGLGLEGRPHAAPAITPLAPGDMTQRPRGIDS